MRQRLDRFMGGLARLSMRVFFSHVELAGTAKTPLDGPLIVVGNHQNSLIDPALITGFLPRHPRLLAKSTLWQVPFTRWLVRLGGAIPVYRQQDNVDVSKNAEMFARCYEEMYAGGVIALFPEGISHDEPALQALKTGAARIVLESEARRPGTGIRIVPAGLIFDERTRFRSRALIQFGDPIDPSPDQRDYAERPREAVRSLTARIERALADVTLNYESWEQARLIERVAELVARDNNENRGRARLKEKSELQRRFIEGHRRIAQMEPGRVADLATEVRRYDRMLSVAGLEDHQVDAVVRRGRALSFLARFAGFLIVGAVAISVGVLLNIVPYKLCAWAATRTANRDMIATMKVVSGIFLFPFTWIAEAVATGWRWGWPFGLAMAVAAPLTGYIALEGHDRRQRFTAELRAWLLLRTRKRLADELRRQRREILDEVGRLAALLPYAD